MQSEGRPYPVYLSLLRHPRPASSPCLEQCGEDCCAVQVRSYEFLPDAGPSKQCRRVVPRRVEMHGYSFVCGEGDRAAAASDGDAHGGAVKILEKNLQRQPDGSHRTIEAGVTRLMARLLEEGPAPGFGHSKHGTVIIRSRHGHGTVTAQWLLGHGTYLLLKRVPHPARPVQIRRACVAAPQRALPQQRRGDPPLAPAARLHVGPLNHVPCAGIVMAQPWYGRHANQVRLG